LELYAYRQGNAHSIYFLEVHPNRDVKAFLENLARFRTKDARGLIARLDLTASNGIVWNPSHTRALRHNAKPICEFKNGKSRLLWFRDSLDSENLICTNGFKKSSDETPQSEIQVALSRMELFYKSRATLLDRK
jgi:phage-related protein